jgi:hypothetical protein
MPTNYTGADIFHATITIAVDGDLESAASVSSPLEALIDNTQYLANRASGIICVAHGVFTAWGSVGGWGTQTSYDDTISSGYPVSIGTLTGLLAGDVVEVTAACTQVYDQTTLNGANLYLRLETAEGSATTTTALPGAVAVFNPLAAIAGAPTVSCRTTLLGQYTIAGTGVTLYVNGKVDSALGADSQYSLILPGPLNPGNTLAYRVWRVVS